MLRGRFSCLSCLSVCNVGVFWPNGWTNQDATWYGGRPQRLTRCRHGPRLGPGDIVLDGDPAPTRKGAQQPPLFGPLCSGTVAHLSNCRALVLIALLPSTVSSFLRQLVDWPTVQSTGPAGANSLLIYRTLDRRRRRVGWRRRRQRAIINCFGCCGWSWWWWLSSVPYICPC